MIRKVQVKVKQTGQVRKEITKVLTTQKILQKPAKQLRSLMIIKQRLLGCFLHVL